MKGQTKTWLTKLLNCCMVVGLTLWNPSATAALKLFAVTGYGIGMYQTEDTAEVKGYTLEGSLQWQLGRTGLSAGATWFQGKFNERLLSQTRKSTLNGFGPSATWRLSFLAFDLENSLTAFLYDDFTSVSVSQKTVNGKAFGYSLLESRSGETPFQFRTAAYLSSKSSGKGRSGDSYFGLYASILSYKVSERTVQVSTSHDTVRPISAAETVVDEQLTFLSFGFIVSFYL
ncbi:MAG: hypothetical protein HRU19_25015 [Pseudobacteriovorax sp.]|nr:hypothetical protein [Pseudobacteriovorax sp.]